LELSERASAGLLFLRARTLPPCRFSKLFRRTVRHPGSCNPRRPARSCATSQPASSSAPRVMSPLMPEKQSNTRVSWEYAAARYCQVRKEMCPSGAFRYYRRRCGVSNLGWRCTPPPGFSDLRNLKDLRTECVGSAETNGVTVNSHRRMANDASRKSHWMLTIRQLARER